jgi:thiosulfate/3-mercaptopyruvate sulfurtransferase
LTTDAQQQLRGDCGNDASGWWFVLTQILGYDNVKFYDGSAQEWVRYYDTVPYQWE